MEIERGRRNEERLVLRDVGCGKERMKERKKKMEGVLQN